MQNNQYVSTIIKTRLGCLPRSAWLALLVIICLMTLLAGCTLRSLGPEQAEETVTVMPETGIPTGIAPSATVPVIAVAPLSVAPGTTVAVSGAGWSADTAVALNLEVRQANLTQILTVITTTTDVRGQFAASFVYPVDGIFSQVSAVQVTALALERGESATAALSVIAASATPAATAPLPATATVTTTTTLNLPLVQGAATPSSTPLPTPDATTTPTPTPTNLAAVISNALNLRNAPSVDAAILRTIPGGTKITVLGQNAAGDWLFVQLADGVQGWVARMYTDYRNSAPVIAAPPPPAPIVVAPATSTPAPTVTPTPTPTAPVITDWRGEYFANALLSGAPLLVRNDSVIDFDWGGGAPAAMLPADGFSVRWTRNLYFYSGRYRFHTLMDDGMRLFVDNILVVDEWRDGSVRELTADRWLDEGTHSLRVEYYEYTGVGRARVWWERIDATPTSFPDWKGEYWSNRRLDGDPTVVRNDGDIDFNWGNGAPDAALPADNFSARWTRRVTFSAGVYRFSARADDGIRFYLDGNRLIDEWHDSDGSVVYTVDVPLDGRYSLEVEYYERGGAARVEFWWQRLAATPTPTWTPLATATPTNTPTATNTPSPTNTPTPTPTATPTPTPLPYATIQPSSGVANTPVTVSGGGFPANTVVNLHLATLVRASQTGPAIHVYATTQTDNRGNYSMAFAMPSQWPDGTTIEPGQIVLVVATADFSAQASAFFDYILPLPTVAPNPYVRLEPSSGGADTRVLVSGGGFPARTTVNTYLAQVVQASAAAAGGKVYATTPTDANGNYSMSFVMPAEWPDGAPIAAGQIVVLVATNDFGLQTSALFTYQVVQRTPTLHVEPSSGGPGAQITVNGDGFPANTPVNLHLGEFDAQIGAGSAQRYATTTTDANGAYRMVFALPATWPDGAPITVDQLLLMVATDDFSVQVTATFKFVPPTPVPPTNTPPPPTDTPTTAPPTATPLPPTDTPLPPTDTPTPVPPTATVTPSPTEAPSLTPTATPTDTPLPPTDTPLPPTDTPTPMPTDTPVPPTETPTLAPTDTVIPAPTDTPLPTETPTSLPPDTPVPPTDTPTPVPRTPDERVMFSSENGKIYITVSGDGFPALTQVTVYLGRFNGGISEPRELQQYAATTTDQRGSYIVAFAMPDAWPDGAPIEAGKLQISVLAQDAKAQTSAVIDYNPSTIVPYVDSAVGPR